MALNLTPEYFEADRQYRQARTHEEKLAALEAMLRAIPKHKASEKKQADLKRKISELRSAPAAHKKGTVVDPYHVPPQGAGQALLIGPPNSGKSSIVGGLTKAPVKITDFPYGTPVPVPGMAYHEDAPIELVDLPPVAGDDLPGGLVNALRHTNVVLFVADLTAPQVLEDLEGLLALLARHEFSFEPPDAEDEGGHMRVDPQGLILCNKVDLPGARDTFEVLKELGPRSPDMLATSAVTGEGLDEMLARVFAMLDVIRIYSKEPGKPADQEKPFILPTGSTVEELARHIHKDLAVSLKFARVWGEHGHAGQQVHSRHVLHDRDIVEIHA